MKHVYDIPHIPSSAFPHLFVVNDAPPEMTVNVGRACYLKLVEGMSNPYNVAIDGVPVAPAWRKKLPRGGRQHPAATEPTDQPRLFQVVGLQHDYRGQVCYRIHASDGDLIGRCAGRDAVIFTKPLPSPAK